MDQLSEGPGVKSAIEGRPVALDQVKMAQNITQTAACGQQHLLEVGLVGFPVVVCRKVALGSRRLRDDGPTIGIIHQVNGML